MLMKVFTKNSNKKSNQKEYDSVEDPLSMHYIKWNSHLFRNSKYVDEENVIIAPGQSKKQFQV